MAQVSAPPSFRSVSSTASSQPMARASRRAISRGGDAHGDDGDGGAGDLLLDLEGGLNAALVVGVDDGGHAVPDQGIGNRVDLDLGGVRHLLHANNNLHV